MKRSIFLLLLSIILVSHTAFSQERLYIDYAETGRMMESERDRYDKLFDRYTRFDSTLTHEEYAFIYYGHSFTDLYEPVLYGIAIDLLNQEKYNEALVAAKKELDLNPVSIQALYRVAWALNALDDPEYKKYLDFYSAMANVILRSGDCVTPETAMKVIYIGDEYQIMRNILHITDLRKHPAREDEFDIFDVAPSDIYPYNRIFFDISRSRLKIREMFEGQEAKNL